ncbi:MAG: SDR family NAD(P)-dependent oxidoreductase [Saprospiraceae bacterium]
MNSSKKYVAITGAYGGLGEAMSKEYYNAGYGLVLLGRDMDKLMKLKKSINDTEDIITLQTDVSNWDSCLSAYKKLKECNVNIDTLINNAGITYIKKFDKDYEIDKYQQLISTNLNGPVFMSRVFIEDLIKNNGNIINISSVIGYAPVIGRTAYAASKFGMEGFSSVLSAELKDKVHILMVYPTFIQTSIRKDIEGDKTINEILTADYVAKKIIEAQKNKKTRLYLGKTAKLSYYLYKFLPKLYLRLMTKKTHDVS